LSAGDQAADQDLGDRASVEVHAVARASVDFISIDDGVDVIVNLDETVVVDGSGAVRRR
jgi:hypothetical protein